jgi:hypothetical protein
MVAEKTPDEIKAEAEELYNSVGHVVSPALGGVKIHFTSDGFHHLMNTKNRYPRPQEEWLTKLKYLPRAIDLLRIATTYQEYDVFSENVRIKRKKKKIMAVSEVKYWGIIGIIDNKKVRVVVRKAGNGQHQFCSVMPCWNIQRHGDHKVGSTAEVDLNRI